MKADSGSYAVFTEQSSPASQLTAAKVVDVLAILPDCDGQAADAMSAHTQEKMEDAPRLLRIPKSECPDVWTRLPRHKSPKSWEDIEDAVVPLERKLCGHPLAGLSGDRQLIRGSSSGAWMGISTELGMSICSSKNRDHSNRYTWMTSKWLERSSIWLSMWMILMKNVGIAEPTSFLDHVHLGCTQRECKPNETIIEQ